MNQSAALGEGLLFMFQMYIPLQIHFLERSDHFICFVTFVQVKRTLCHNVYIFNFKMVLISNFVASEYFELGVFGPYKKNIII